jgi:hypothetical protein
MSKRKNGGYDCRGPTIACREATSRRVTELEARVKTERYPGKFPTLLLLDTLEVDHFASARRVVESLLWQTFQPAFRKLPCRLLRIADAC